MREIGARIVGEKKVAIMNSTQGIVEKDNRNVKSKDLLTLLLRANMAEDLPENQRMSDGDLAARESRLFLLQERKMADQISEIPTQVALFLLFIIIMSAQVSN